MTKKKTKLGRPGTTVVVDGIKFNPIWKAVLYELAKQGKTELLTLNATYPKFARTPNTLVPLIEMKLAEVSLPFIKGIHFKKTSEGYSALRTPLAK